MKILEDDNKKLKDDLVHSSISLQHAMNDRDDMEKTIKVGKILKSTWLGIDVFAFRSSRLRSRSTFRTWRRSQTTLRWRRRLTRKTLRRRKRSLSNSR